MHPKTALGSLEHQKRPPGLEAPGGTRGRCDRQRLPVPRISGTEETRPRWMRSLHPLWAKPRQRSDRWPKGDLDRHLAITVAVGICRGSRRHLATSNPVLPCGDKNPTPRLRPPGLAPQTKTPALTKAVGPNDGLLDAAMSCPGPGPNTPFPTGLPCLALTEQPGSVVERSLGLMTSHAGTLSPPTVVAGWNKRPVMATL